jgi:FO synthase
MTIGSIFQARSTTHALSDAEALALANVTDLDRLLPAAAAIRDEGHGDLVTVSRKVFIPLTQLCRDVCHYCTFAHTPRRREAAYLAPESSRSSCRTTSIRGWR